MENEKKSSRLGVRLSAVLVAVLIVVCMAVPAFAVTIDPNEYNGLPFPLRLPDSKPNYLLVKASGDDYYFLVAFDKLAAGYPCLNNGTSFYFGENVYLRNVSLEGEFTTDSWKQTSSTPMCNVDSVMSNSVIYNADGGILYEPPAPSFMDRVGSGLTVVLDWVGATVTALFSGELSGLLPLVAVPVAITILIVAIVVIKRSIWGA